MYKRQTDNNVHSREWYAGKDRGNQPRVYSVEDEGYDPVVPVWAGDDAVFEKMRQFIEKAYEFGDRIGTGVLLENRAVPTFEQRLAERTTEYAAVSYTHLRAHETVLDLVCRLLLEKKKKKQEYNKD